MDNGVLGEVAVDEVLFDPDIAVWSGRSNAQEEGLLRGYSIVEESTSFLGKHVR